MKKAFVLFATMVLLLSSMSNAILYANFKLNQAEIERLYCVNKDMPQKHCHGKCHLKKQLAENSQASNQPTPKSSLEDSFKLNFFHQPMAALASPADDDSQGIIRINPTSLHPRNFGDSLFQPPDSQLFTN